jgi:hypothetical protein
VDGKTRLTVGFFGLKVVLRFLEVVLRFWKSFRAFGSRSALLKVVLGAEKPWCTLTAPPGAIAQLVRASH